MVKENRLSHSGEQRESGKQQVIDTIRAAGSIARIDISTATRVSPATVTAITAELIDVGLIEEIIPDVPRQEAKRGRPRVALKIRGDAHRIAGIKVSHRVISVVLLDFEGNDIVDHEMPLQQACMPVSQLCTSIMDALAQACSKGGFDISTISGIGVGLAGLVDAKRNFVYWSSSLDERNVDFGAHLAQHTPCPIFIDNDANLVAKAEHLFGKGQNVSDFVVITIEHGVGMGIVINNEIYRGSRGCGAEFGHTKVQLEGALCQCGQRGCLEAYVGDYALLREANITNGGVGHRDLGQLVEAAQSGDQMACSIFDRAGRMFAMGLANVVNVFDPKLIILSGARLSFDYLYSEQVIQEMQRWVVQVDAPPPEVLVHSWGDLMWAKGAAAYAIEEVSALAIRELASSEK
ncbi:ROK family protein [Parasedimentitalea maritima]|uniref:ROK family protein n=1 Tax=Parasedimentitalea maritima TaxID=2578117 RepID=A0ABY2UU61_9RHOB|nr:ROK family protein [Zongyanglinia marina]TLP62827.1 ROK family protein [Zongyanglinia marina]